MSVRTEWNCGSPSWKLVESVARGGEPHSEAMRPWSLAATGSPTEGDEIVGVSGWGKVPRGRPADDLHCSEPPANLPPTTTRIAQAFAADSIQEKWGKAVHFQNLVQSVWILNDRGLRRLSPPEHWGVFVPWRPERFHVLIWKTI